VPAKDYYLVLGVPRTASARSIREAFRGLAKSHHPDVAGAGGTPQFKEIAEAYETLSDPARRRRYNDQLARAAVLAGPAVPGRGRPEPLVREPIAVAGRPETVRPSFEQLYEHLLRNFLGLPKAPRARALNLEVVLSAKEARTGGSLPLTLPSFEPCPACRGSGAAWPWSCSQCAGRGWTEVRRHVEVRVPPIASEGVLDVPLTDLGIHNLFLRLHLHIEG
jgi:molecular chaperone DnaJ